MFKMHLTKQVEEGIKNQTNLAMFKMHLRKQVEEGIKNQTNLTTIWNNELVYLNLLE